MKKSRLFYISRANIKSATNCPLLMRALRALKKMTAGAENMMHTHGSIKKLIVPKELTGKNLELTVSTQLDGWDAVNPQFIAYVDGKLQQGLDVNHREIFLDNAKGEYDIFLYAYSGRNDCLLDFNVTLNAYYEKRTPSLL